MRHNIVIQLSAQFEIQ